MFDASGIRGFTPRNSLAHDTKKLWLFKVNPWKFDSIHLTGIACGTGFGKCPAVRTVMIGSSPKPVVKPKIAASTVAPKTDLWRSVETMPTTNDSKTIAPANSNINADG